MTYLVNLSDLHAGSKSAVCVPGFPIGDDRTLVPYPSNKVQDWINACMADALARVKRMVRGQRVVLNLGGDMTDGDRHHNTRTTYGTPTEQAAIAVRLLLPWANLADRVVAVGGTEVHAGGEGEIDGSVASQLTSDMYAHRNLDIDGHLFDLAHHCSLPQDPRNWGPSLSRQAGKIVEDRRRRGYRVPDVIWRGHVHRFAKGLYEDTLMVTNPAWQLRTPFMARVAPANLYTVGLTVIDCKTLKVTPITYEAEDDETEVVRFPSNDY